MNKLIKWFLDLFKRKSKWVKVVDSGTHLIGLDLIYIGGQVANVVKVDHKNGRIKVRLNKV